MELRDKVVVITGGGRGLGISIALALAREGARFVLAARTESELNGVRDEVTPLGAEAITAPTDVADPQQIADLAKATLDRFGTVDVIINNAGAGTVLGPVQDTTLEYWEPMINTNAHSAFLLTKALLPTMLANQSGHVININSTVAKKGVSTASAYTFSVEPGIYFPGRWGVRIEDTLLVTETGGERLSHCSRDIQVVS
jgi:NAD(P)-dependent dehydrogenase (short-subunit alcohol dehydrogenase family)